MRVEFVAPFPGAGKFLLDFEQQAKLLPRLLAGKRTDIFRKLVLESLAGKQDGADNFKI